MLRPRRVDGREGRPGSPVVCSSRRTCGGKSRQVRAPSATHGEGLLERREDTVALVTEVGGVDRSQRHRAAPRARATSSVGAADRFRVTEAGAEPDGAGAQRRFHAPAAWSRARAASPGDPRSRGSTRSVAWPTWQPRSPPSGARHRPGRDSPRRSGTNPRRRIRRRPAPGKRRPSPSGARLSPAVAGDDSGDALAHLARHERIGQQSPDHRACACR